ncbi:hypothetical protein V8C86DRAFT_2544057 [Haematococcus lacustris]
MSQGLAGASLEAALARVDQATELLGVGTLTESILSLSALKEEDAKLAEVPFGVKASQGQRQQMEDAYSIQMTPPLPVCPCDLPGLAPPQEAGHSPQPSQSSNLDAQGSPSTLPEDLAVLSVFDGHGGTEVAEHCRERLHQHFACSLLQCRPAVQQVQPTGSLVYRPRQVGDALRTAFNITDRELLGTETGDFVGATAVVAVVGKTHIWVAHCGDSRAVIQRNGEAEALTRDHKPDREDEAARIKAAGGRIVYNSGSHRVMGMLAMSRAIGDHYLRPYVIAEPEVACIERTPSDEVLVLATDGLWDVFSCKEATTLAMRCIVRSKERGMSRHGACRVAASVLTKVALERGSRDNITVIVVDITVQLNFREEEDRQAGHQPASSASTQAAHSSGGAAAHRAAPHGTSSNNSPTPPSQPAAVLRQSLGAVQHRDTASQPGLHVLDAKLQPMQGVQQSDKSQPAHAWRHSARGQAQAAQSAEPASVYASLSASPVGQCTPTASPDSSSDSSSSECSTDHHSASSLASDSCCSAASACPAAAKQPPLAPPPSQHTAEEPRTLDCDRTALQPGGSSSRVPPQLTGGPLPPGEAQCGTHSRAGSDTHGAPQLPDCLGTVAEEQAKAKAGQAAASRAVSFADNPPAIAPAPRVAPVPGAQQPSQLPTASPSATTLPTKEAAGSKGMGSKTQSFSVGTCLWLKSSSGKLNSGSRAALQESELGHAAGPAMPSEHAGAARAGQVGSPACARRATEPRTALYRQSSSPFHADVPSHLSQSSRSSASADHVSVQWEQDAAPEQQGGPGRGLACVTQQLSGIQLAAAHTLQPNPLPPSQGATGRDMAHAPGPVKSSSSIAASQQQASTAGTAAGFSYKGEPADAALCSYVDIDASCGVPSGTATRERIPSVAPGGRQPASSSSGLVTRPAARGQGLGPADSCHLAGVSPPSAAGPASSSRWSSTGVLPVAAEVEQQPWLGKAHKGTPRSPSRLTSSQPTQAKAVDAGTATTGAGSRPNSQQSMDEVDLWTQLGRQHTGSTMLGGNRVAGLGVISQGASGVKVKLRRRASLQHQALQSSSDQPLHAVAGDAAAGAGIHAEHIL